MPAPCGRWVRVVRHARDPRHRAWAYGLLEQSIAAGTGLYLPAGLGVRAPRSVDYLTERPEDLALRGLARDPGRSAARPSAEQPAPGWTWFEDVLSYDNARLAQAVIAAGHQAERADWQREGLEALDWLCEAQTADVGPFPADRLERLLAARQ